MEAYITASFTLAKNHLKDLNQQENMNMKDKISIPKDTVELPNGEIVQVSKNMVNQVKTMCQICLEFFLH